MRNPGSLKKPRRAYDREQRVNYGNMMSILNALTDYEPMKVTQLLRNVVMGEFNYTRHVELLEKYHYVVATIFTKRLSRTITRMRKPVNMRDFVFMSLDAGLRSRFQLGEFFEPMQSSEVDELLASMVDGRDLLAALEDGEVMYYRTVPLEWVFKRPDVAKLENMAVSRRVYLAK